MAKKKDYWFTLGKYKRGWNPSTWQGWTVLGIYLAFVFYKLVVYNSTSTSLSETIFRAFPSFAFATVVLLLIAYYKGEKPQK